MNTQQLYILHLEDDPIDAELIAATLKEGGFETTITRVDSREDFQRALTKEASYEIILADYTLPSFDGIEGLHLAQELRPDLPFIFISATLGEELAVESLKNGATDYVLKQGLSRLVPAVKRALRESEEKRRREQAEKELKQQTIELARSNADLEQFAYVASHDLQEPLRKIVNYTELIEKRYRDKLDDKAIRYMNYVVSGATRMQEMVQDLLQYSRVGRKEAPWKVTDLNNILQRALSNLACRIEETQATVHYDSLPELKVNATQMLQLLQNLLSNSLKFCKKDQPPEIYIKSELTQEQDFWIISVADNGIGIPSDYQQHIFAIFQRIHSKKEYPGSGIGLAICKKIVERHGGKIWFESEYDEGATFYFTLPNVLD